MCVCACVRERSGARECFRGENHREKVEEHVDNEEDDGGEHRGVVDGLDDEGTEEQDHCGRHHPRDLEF